MPWPSTLTSFSNPIPTDRLNSPSHSSVETAQNTGLTELQTFIGVNTGATASAVGTILYDVKAPDSNGGGHVQTANKGGTGQTTFTKGDVLVAQNTSTLSKLAVGSDGQTLVADSSVVTGVKWGSSSNNKIYTLASVVAVTGTGEKSIFSTTVLGSTIGTSGAIRATAYLGQMPFINNSVYTAFQYGGQTVGSIVLAAQSAPSGSIYGYATHTIIANASVNSQRHFMNINFTGYSADTGTGATSANIKYTPFVDNLGSVFALIGSDRQISSINSSANQTFGMTVRDLGNSGAITYSGIIVEKIN